MSTEVLEHVSKNPFFARRLAAGVDDDRHDGAPRPLGELRTDRGVLLATERLVARALRENEEAVARTDALLPDLEDVQKVLTRRLAADRHHAHVLSGLLEKRQMGEGRLRDIAERPERVKNRRQQNRLGHRHVIREVHDGPIVVSTPPETLDDDVHAKTLRRGDRGEADVHPFLSRETPERLGDGTVGEDARDAQRVAQRRPEPGLRATRRAASVGCAIAAGLTQLALELLKGRPGHPSPPSTGFSLAFSSASFASRTRLSSSWMARSCWRCSARSASR